MLTIHAAERGTQTTNHGPLHPSPFVDRLLRCYTQPEWRIATQTPSAASHEGADSTQYDAAIQDLSNSPEAIQSAAKSLRQLGRLFLVSNNQNHHAIEQVINPIRGQFSPIADLVSATGERVIIAERTPPDGVDFANKANLRADVHLGAYKMSRYRTYHAMQAAVAQLLPIDDGNIRDVIEIGDTNGVIRAMLGHSPRSYFQARYPEHDLQTLDKLASDSFDVFICDNTLEHVSDPHAGLRQMHRVLRPGGWAILMLPFIAMAQDDDRCRFSPLALGEALRDQFPEGVIGSWGNVDAGCVYLRDNKWSRVHRTDWPVNAPLADCTMQCRDSRNAQAPIVNIPCRNDRQHPIHVWAVVRKPSLDGPAPEHCPSTRSFTALEPGERQATELLSTRIPKGEPVTVLGVRDGSLLDELARLGFQVSAIEPEPWRVNHATMRGHRAFLQSDPMRSEARDAIARSLALCDLRTDSSVGLGRAQEYLQRRTECPRLLVTADHPAWNQIAAAPHAAPVHGPGPSIRAWTSK